jgi:uncharacterized protein (DUF3084 family)
VSELSETFDDYKAVVRAEMQALREEIRHLRDEHENVRLANIEGSQWVDCAKQDIARLTRERDEARALIRKTEESLFALASGLDSFSQRNKA